MTIHLDLRGTEATFTRPEILQHPQIPGPLSGMNPRSILSREWWDTTRQAAYRANAYHCYACGGSPDDDPHKSQLDAHECYYINWKKAMATYIETVALCWSCHNFIHAGRLRSLVDVGKEEEDVLCSVLRHGMCVLQAADLLPYWRTWALAKETLDGAYYGELIAEARRLGIVEPYDVLRLPDNRWTLNVQGTLYRRDEHDKIVTKTTAPATAA